MQQFNLATFDSTHQALKFEKVMKNSKVNINVIPVPRELTANCGLAVMFSDEIEKIKQIAEEHEVVVKGYFNVNIQENRKVYNERV